MTILNNKERNITKKLSSSEKQLGVDIKLTPENDLELNNVQDFSLIAGVNNVAQAASIKLKTENKGNRFHPIIGVDYPVGSKTTSAITLKFDILKSLRQDTRFETVDVFVNITGNVYIIDIRLRVLGLSLSIPLQFTAIS